MTHSRALLMLLAPVPALILGVLLMMRTGVKTPIWGSQLVAGLVLWVLCVGVRLAPRKPAQAKPWASAIVACVALLLLAATLAQPELDGVRRWLPLGPLQLHAAFVVLPALLIVLSGPRSEHKAWWFAGAASIAAIVLALQPDASQASAFAIAVAVILHQRKRRPVSDWVAAGIVAGAAVLSWARPDPLEPVPHVEGIMHIAADTGAGWLVAAVIAAVLLPLPFVWSALRRRDLRLPGLALAAYFAVVCSAPFVAPFPVPILGFGLSPIVGYFAALGWVVRNDQ